MSILKQAMEDVSIPKESFVFLGGTCNGSKWRDKLIDIIKVPYFNPIVTVWDEQAKKLEDKAKAAANIQLYVITPRQKGSYSIAELTHASAFARDLHIEVVIAFINEEDQFFDEHQVKSNNAIIELITSNDNSKDNVYVFNTLEEIANYLNEQLELK
jgi:hypothetical protein